jgi:NAD-dependent dihydropyrimidine dehydrogenase PreA subunit
MFYIDKTNCVGCGECLMACSKKAITNQNGYAVIDQELCNGCGNCLSICPTNAIRELVQSSSVIKKGGDKMYHGYGRGFGFRGSSPPWPYTGRGRGGLPRCWYPGMSRASIHDIAATSYWGAPIHEDELSILREQAEVTKRQLDDIEHRIRDLEKKESQ